MNEFLSEIDVLEKQRICDVLVNYTSNSSTRNEDLIYFSKKANEEHEKEVKPKKKNYQQKYRIIKKIIKIMKMSYKLDKEQQIRL